MRNLFTGFIVVFLFISSAFAQEFEIRDFRVDPSDMAARRYERLSVNNEPCALIKVTTNIRGMQFDSNIGIVDVVHQQDGYWVYVAPRERRIRLMASGYLSIDLDLPEPARSSTVYSLFVTTKGALAPVSDLVRLTFRINENNVYIRYGDNAPVLSLGHNSVFNVPKGENRFTFIKEGFKEEVVTMNVQQEQVVEVNLTPGTLISRLNLSGWIIVSSEPAGAEVYLNNQRVGTTPYQGRQMAGQYSLMLRYPLYKDHTELFELNEGSTVTLPQITLLPQFGYLSLTSQPSGADVYLNDRFVGQTPITRMQVQSGVHEVSVSMNLHRDFKESIIIEDLKENNLRVTLREAFGELVITSDPAGATVSLDGRTVGETPFESRRHSSGVYTLVLRKNLYSDIREHISVQDGERTERFFAMTANFGTLKVNAPESDIYLNGQWVGNSEYSGNIAPGEYTVAARRESHDDVERTIYVHLGETESLFLAPRTKQGAISIESRPFATHGAEIYINGQRMPQTTPASIPLDVGTYNVTIRKPGYQYASRTIDVTEGIERELVFELRRIDPRATYMAKRHKTFKIIYGTSMVAAAGAGAYYINSQMTLADRYKTATHNATAIYDRMERHEIYSFVSFGAAATLGIMTIVRASRQKRAERLVNLSAYPVKDGVLIGMTLNLQ